MNRRTMLLGLVTLPLVDLAAVDKARAIARAREELRAQVDLLQRLLDALERLKWDLPRGKSQ